MIDNYDDIINIKHFDPKKHLRMSIEKRAAQFAPFAALTGYNEAVIETGRITDNEIYLDDEFKEEISNKINLLLKNKEIAEFTYFVKDSKKSGGSYKKIKSSIKKIDYLNRLVYLTNKEKIIIDNIIDIIFENDSCVL